MRNVAARCAGPLGSDEELELRQTKASSGTVGIRLCLLFGHWDVQFEAIVRARREVKQPRHSSWAQPKRVSGFLKGSSSARSCRSRTATTRAECFWTVGGSPVGRTMLGTRTSRSSVYVVATGVRLFSGRRRPTAIIVASCEKEFYVATCEAMLLRRSLFTLK